MFSALNHGNLKLNSRSLFERRKEVSRILEEFLRRLDLLHMGKKSPPKTGETMRVKSSSKTFLLGLPRVQVYGWPFGVVKVSMHHCVISPNPNHWPQKLSGPDSGADFFETSNSLAREDAIAPSCDLSKSPRDSLTKDFNTATPTDCHQPPSERSPTTSRGYVATFVARLFLWTPFYRGKLDRRRSHKCIYICVLWPFIVKRLGNRFEPPRYGIFLYIMVYNKCRGHQVSTAQLGTFWLWHRLHESYKCAR